MLTMLTVTTEEEEVNSVFCKFFFSIYFYFIFLLLLEFFFSASWMCYKVIVPPNQAIHKCLPELFGTLPGLWGRRVYQLQRGEYFKLTSYKTVEFLCSCAVQCVLGYLLRSGSLYTLKFPPILKFQR